MTKYIQIYLTIVQMAAYSVFFLNRIGFLWAQCFFGYGLSANLPARIWARITLFLGENGGKLWALLPVAVAVVLIGFRKRIVENKKALNALVIVNAVLITLLPFWILMVYSNVSSLGIGGIGEPPFWPYFQ